jgi:hypothetical protein
MLRSRAISQRHRFDALMVLPIDRCLHPSISSLLCRPRIGQEGFGGDELILHNPVLLPEAPQTRLGQIAYLIIITTIRSMSS